MFFFQSEAKNVHSLLMSSCCDKWHMHRLIQSHLNAHKHIHTVPLHACVHQRSLYILYTALVHAVSHGVHIGASPVSLLLHLAYKFQNKQQFLLYTFSTHFFLSYTLCIEISSSHVPLTFLMMMLLWT